MSMLTDSLISLAKPSLALAQALTKDIGAERFARLAPGKQGPIEANHPAWIIGHLSIYPHMALLLVGDDDGAPEPIANGSWTPKFAHGAPMHDDPEGIHYPDKDTLVGTFVAETERVMAALPSVDDGLLAAPQTVERWKERMPRVYDSFAFLLGPHAMFHLGQLSTWRRAEGLGSAM